MILVKIHFIRSTVITIPTAALAIQLLARGRTAARYTTCPLRKTRIPIRKIILPFSLKTQRRLRRISAIHPRTRPIRINFAKWPPSAAITPTITKQSEASPFRIVAATYFSLFSSIMNNAARERQRIQKRVIIFPLLPCKKCHFRNGIKE